MKELYNTTRTRMQKALESLEHNLSVLRTGRANPGMLNKLHVDYYGSQMGITALANVTVPDARTLVITPYDRGSLAAIEKAIRDSDLGLNPNNKGDAIFISVPALTEERRRDLVKNAKTYAEEARVAVRNVRHDAIKSVQQLEKDKAASQDESKRAQTEIQKITDEFTGKIDDILERKEQEILH